jgi:hypothetical protein
VIITLTPGIRAFLVCMHVCRYFQMAFPPNRLLLALSDEMRNFISNLLLRFGNWIPNWIHFLADFFTRRRKRFLLIWLLQPLGYLLQGCQMIHFQTKSPNLGKFWSVLQLNMSVNFKANKYILCYLVHFMAIWYILWLFWYFSICMLNQKNLASLVSCDGILQWSYEH